MTRILPIVPCLLSVMAVAVAGQEVDSPPQTLMLTAIRTLESRETISTKVRHEVSLFGKHLMGSGVYLEQRSGRDSRLRMELKLQLGERPCSLIEVCDGRYLWQFRNLPSETKLTRLDVVRAMRAVDQSDPPAFRFASAAMPGLGGLSHLLRGLDASFDFTIAQSGRWGYRKQLVWRLQGVWKRELLARLLPRQKERIEKGEQPDLTRLAPHLPDHVVLILDQEDLFPCEIQYRRMLAEGDDAIEGEDSRAVVTMSFYDAAVNVPIDISQFVYNPGNVEFSDLTDSYIESLRAKEPAFSPPQ